MERLKDFMADKHNRDQVWRTMERSKVQKKVARHAFMGIRQENMRELSLHDDYLLYKHVEDGANTKATRSPGKQVHFSKVRYVLAVAHEVVKEVNARTGETKIVGRKPSSRWKIQMLDRKEADYEFIADTVEGRDAWVDGTRQNLHTYRRRRGLDDLLASPKYHMDEVAEKFSVTNLADPADVLPMTTLDKVEEE